jgi:O-antigen/teichoic acid export membrane protein
LGIVGLRLVQPDTAVVAYFAIAMQFFTTLMVFPVSLSQAIVPGLSRAYRNQTEDDLQTVATAMKAALIIGSMVAVVANAIGPWIITVLFGDRYLAAGNTFGWICWAIGPYAAVFMAAQALNALGARGMGALTALVMVGVHVGVMAVLLALGQWTVGGLIGGPIESTVAGLLAGSIFGAVVGLTALGSRVKIPGHGWWIKPMILSAIPVAIMYIIPLPKLISGLLSLFLLAVLTWKTGIFSRTELDRIAGRLRATHLVAKFWQD